MAQQIKVDTAPIEDWQPEVGIDVESLPKDDEWDGRLTRLKARGAMLYGVRDKGGAGDKVIRRVVLGRGDDFTMRCSKIRGRWVGPDAAALELLFKSGEILGSKEAEAKDAKIAAVEHARAVYPGSHPAFPNGRPGLRSLDKARAEAQHRRYLGDQKEVLRAEGQEARADRVEQNETIAALVQAIAGSQGVAKDWPGAEGPGTGPVKATGENA